jgi:DNA-binding MarR family transcriptional regulator
MEKNVLLIRQTSEHDSRINYLVLKDKGLEMVDFLKKDRKYTEGIMMDGISDDEYLIFTQVIDKIRKNLERI